MANFISFPKGFQWGTATASYQVEGAVQDDGRGETVWDVFSHTPGKILNNDTGDVACDMYHSYPDDIRTMKALDIKAYRFSLAWSRILPEGRGNVNQVGLDAYDRLIDELCKVDILPLITLFHWDLPTALEGGWLNRATVDAFVDYTELVVKKYGDRVKNWITINEPWCASFLGYGIGIHAPGDKDTAKAIIAAHHLLLAHGEAIPVIRENCTGAQVGIALNMGPQYAPSRSEGDLAAMRLNGGRVDRWFLDPLYGQRYPADIVANYIQTGAMTSYEPEFIHEGDFEKIAAPTDFLALNYYTRNIVSAKSSAAAEAGEIESIPSSENIQTDMGWEVYPFGLYETLNRLYWEYKPPQIIITENGAAYADGPDSTGRVRDEKRTEYLMLHVKAVNQAIAVGVPVTGYYVWSFLDNFEWSLGYSKRFGIVYVDFETQKRYVKDSAYWYQRLIQQNGFFEE